MNSGLAVQEVLSWHDPLVETSRAFEGKANHMAQGKAFWICHFDFNTRSKGSRVLLSLAMFSYTQVFFQVCQLVAIKFCTEQNKRTSCVGNSEIRSLICLGCDFSFFSHFWKRSLILWNLWVLRHGCIETAQIWHTFFFLIIWAYKSTWKMGTFLLCS